MMPSFLFFFAILAACASIGSSLQCYECTPTAFPGAVNACDNPFNVNNAKHKVCHSNEVCLKQLAPKVSIGGQDIPPSVVFRGCAPKEICSEELPEFTDHCHTCSEDNCNSTVKVIPSLSTVIVLYFIKVFLL